MKTDAGFSFKFQVFLAARNFTRFLFRVPAEWGAHVPPRVLRLTPSSTVPGLEFRLQAVPALSRHSSLVTCHLGVG